MSQGWRGCAGGLGIHPWWCVPVPNCSDTGAGTSKRDTQAYAYQATSSFKFFERSVRQRNCLTAVARQRFNGTSYHPIRCTFLVLRCPSQVKDRRAVADLTEVSCVL